MKKRLKNMFSRVGFCYTFFWWLVRPQGGKISKNRSTWNFFPDWDILAFVASSNVGFPLAAYFFLIVLNDLISSWNIRLLLEATKDFMGKNSKFNDFYWFCLLGVLLITKKKTNKMGQMQDCNWTKNKAWKFIEVDINDNIL